MTVSFEAAIAQFNPELPLAVAFSGGADSTALLLACARKWPGQVAAVHVNHGLQAKAFSFEQHCAAVCEALSIELIVKRVDAGKHKGQSPEDAARIARYAAFRALAPVGIAQAAIKSVAIAQHADDQVETVLLALSRGSGMAGLSGMPASWASNGLQFYRPLLRVSVRDVRDWLQVEGLGHIEDPTNTDTKFTRNRIRAKVLPVLDEVFPQFRETFARTAAHAAQAQELLDELASMDAQGICGPSGGDPQIKAIQRLSQARKSNFLRYWLKRQYGVMPSTAQLSELSRQISACTSRGHKIQIKVGLGFVTRQGAKLVWDDPKRLV